MGLDCIANPQAIKNKKHSPLFKIVEKNKKAQHKAGLFYS